MYILSMQSYGARARVCMCVCVCACVVQPEREGIAALVMACIICGACFARVRACASACRRLRACVRAAAVAADEGKQE